ncbi:DUF4129 domain-containing protein [Lapillicoccus jejuensis]|uniref:Uncharacterized protein DUF4129 n=1 Tax=Lapillicoccus jejuensis TaxID=402171 RepID=A0A542E277_9MICO|nr:DUF4129 domain-containing protein [Lapillicoccus jejuensis]TQJ09438.1 uncharacterized protein DUF4129 [Lapillicoccus jejuensis]
MSVVALLAAHAATHASLLAARLPAALDPDPDTARRWVQEELAGNEYQDRRSLLQRLLDWVQQRLADLQGTPGRGGVSLPPFVIAVLAGAVVVALVVLASRVRRERSTAGGGSATVLGDSTLTAQQLRDRAERAFADGRYDDAVLDHVRATARDADDRTLLSDAPALTAHEVGLRLSQVFPDHAGAVTRATDRFDAVAYGRVAASREDAVDVRDTGEVLRRARPRLTPAPAPAPARAPVAAPVGVAAGAPGARPDGDAPYGDLRRGGRATTVSTVAGSGREDRQGPGADPGSDAVWRGP